MRQNRSELNVGPWCQVASLTHTAIPASSASAIVKSTRNCVTARSGHQSQSTRHTSPLILWAVPKRRTAHNYAVKVPTPR